MWPSKYFDHQRDAGPIFNSSSHILRSAQVDPTSPRVEKTGRSSLHEKEGQHTKIMTMTMNLWKCLAVLSLPLVEGSSLLVYKTNSAYCKGNLTDLEFVSASCPDNEDGCTWGSDVSLFLQVNATSDLPREIKLSVVPSAPHLPGSGLFASYEYQNYTANSCGTELRAPSGEDAGYSCPDAGFYNFRTTFQMFGSSSAWYGSLHGFNVGLHMSLFDAETNENYGVCYAELKVKKGTSSPATDWAFLGGGLASFAAVGLMYRKRRVATLDLRNTESPENGITTNFEMVSDQFVNV